MDMCVVDWDFVAAWVQAIGSIGAIVAAIFIGNRQHRESIRLVEKQHLQNIALVELERKRVAEEAEKQAKEERYHLKEAVFVLLDPFIQRTSDRIEQLTEYKGTTDPLPEQMKTNIHSIEIEAEKTKQSIVSLRDVFVAKPRHLLVHGHLIAALTSICNACHEEKHLDSLRSYRHDQIKQKPFNGPHVQIIDEQPFDTNALVRTLNQLQNVFKTVGE